MQYDPVKYGFKVTRVRTLSELDATLWEMEHIKSGAQLCWLERDDENKTFSIAFKTIPEDSTGVFHILEHSVLCGSDKYPVKEPFVELLKTSVQTFLNALTFSDKTVYPISSRNDKDYLNLMDIYLDAVFHPAIYHNPSIFRQEGWRYEKLDGTPEYQGVVLNEMKGAFASPHEALELAMTGMLFPDNCYSFCSGGDPACIPDLTYEQFIAMHRKYYHPSNSRISLVGRVDLDAALEKLDSFLCAYDRQVCDFTIPMQAPVAAQTRVVPYEVGVDEPADQRAIVSRGCLLGRFDEHERICGASILADYLAGDNDAPLKRAVLDAGLGQNVNVSVSDGTQQAWISWSVWNTDAAKKDEVIDTVRRTLQKIAADGLDLQRLRACCNAFAFRMRDRDGGFAPRSLMEAIGMLDTWLYGGDPADGLLCEDALQKVAVAPDPAFFEGLLRELFLDEEHSVTAVLTPSSTLGAEKAAREAVRVAAEAAAWSDAQKAELEAGAAALTLWQETPDSAEALASIPMLRREDLKQQPDPLPMAVARLDGTTVLRHALKGKLVMFKAIFDLSGLKLEELPAVYMLSRVLGVMGTQSTASEALQMLVKEKIGRFSIAPMVYPGSDARHCRVQLIVSSVCLAEEAEAAAALVREILTETRYDDRKLLRGLLQQIAMGLQMSLTSSGNAYALMRSAANWTAQGVVNDALSGLASVRWMKEKSTADDAALDELLAVMQGLAKRIFTAERLTLSCSENCPDAVLSGLRSAMPVSSIVSDAESCYEPLGCRREGVVVPAAICFASRTSTLERAGVGYTGSLYVLQNILNFAYLWSEIRVKGGAYGCGFITYDNGDVGFYTYRDPKGAQSLGVMDKAADFIRAFCADRPDLNGYVLGCVSALDPLLNDEKMMRTAESRFFRGVSHEDVCRRYHELVAATADDLLALVPVLEQIARDGAACVVGGTALLDACGDQLDSRISI